MGCSADYSHDADGAPIHTDPDIKMSVSHSQLRAAVCIGYNTVSVDALSRDSDEKYVFGIDIEDVSRREQLKRVASRFLAHDEIAFANGTTDCRENCEILLQAWTAKEAIYKACRRPGLNFANDIRLHATSDGFKGAVVTTNDGLRFVFDLHYSYPDKHSLLCVAVGRPTNM